MSESIEVIIGKRLGLREVNAVARATARVSLCEDARTALRATRERLLADVAAGRTIYGVNTGFGALSDQRIPSTNIGDLQVNLLRSHAVGVGDPLPQPVVRALLALRAHTLALGASGASAALVERLLALLEVGVIPWVPSQGSVGASGDLAPLAHLALPVIGEGYAYLDGQRIEAAVALERVGVAPLTLGPKEGLCLINGTQVTAAIGALATWTAAELITAGDIIGALSLDAGLNTAAAFDPRIHAGKPHPGQIRSASIVRELVRESPLAQSHSECGEVQDAYCLRCMPQVHGAVRGALNYVASALAIELNALTDNPLVLAAQDGGYDVISGGNFHAASVAIPLDHLCAALVPLCTISERRTDRFMAPHTSRGLAPFLADDPGLESGFMLVHVTAAALASECKSLSFPASVDTIPTSGGKEDHVSMGPIAARKLARVVDNAALVIAIEAAAAARAIDLRPLPTSPRLQAVHAAIRRHVAPHRGDRSLTIELQALAHAIADGELRRAAELPHELDAA